MEVPDLRQVYMCKRCITTIFGWLRSDRNKVRRTPSTRFLMLPLRNTAYVHSLARPMTVHTSSLIAARQATSPTRTSTQEQRVNDVQGRPTGVQSQLSQSLSSAVKSQQSRPWTAAAGGSVLDELVSWRKLQEPLERYLEFVRCNYFSNDDQSTPTTDTRQLEDDNVTPDTDNQGLSVPVNTIQQDDARLLQRPREQSRHIASHRSSLGR